MTLRRHPRSPILTRDDLPGDPSSVFNPGAVRADGETRLLLRVQTRGRETLLWPARSADGVAFEVAPGPARVTGLGAVRERVHHYYDPRITRVGDDLLVTLAMDVDGGCRTGVFRATEDLATLALVGYEPDLDVRNAVLFPERIGGRWLRLDRPNRRDAPGQPGSGDEIRLAASDDLVRWRGVATVLRGRPHLFDERIGPGPPPVRTEEGWLLVYHGIATHFASVNIYQAGVALLDADDPSRVIARGRENVLEPREPYELAGQVPNVVFPSGLTVSGETVRVYYGAADTVVGLAESTLPELIDACRA